MNGERIIDVHAHIFPDHLAKKASSSIGRFYGMHMDCDGSVAELLKSGNATGDSWHYVVHSSATKPDQVRTINDFIAEEAALHDEFTGFGTIHPGYDDIEGELDRIVTLGLKGLKLHPDLQGFAMDCPQADPIYRAARERHLPILMHMGDEKRDDSSPRRLLAVLERFPGIIVIAAHLGGYRDWKDARLLADAPVYLDTSSTLFALSPETAIDLIRKHGTDRVVFGTDYPMWNHAGEMARFDRLPLTAEERGKILRENAAALLSVPLT